MLNTSNGLKIGVIGVIEREWLATINVLPPRTKYLSAGATVSELAPKLRADGVDMVIVLSHQRQPNDEKLANNLEPGLVDIILGGHDHDYLHTISKKSGIHILRSGTDFKNLSYVEARKDSSGKGWNFEIVRRDVVSAIKEEPNSMAMVEKITAALRPKLEKAIGYTCVPLDARFSTVRTKESNIGNWVCDILRLFYRGDCCMMASGTIRGDQVYPPGVLRIKDIMNCFPFEDPTVVVDCKGSQIVEALENGVYTYPALEGRFPQVSNIQFTFDPAKDPGDRCTEVKIAGNIVQSDKVYRLVTRDYMVRGKDGFTSLMLEGEGGTAKSIVSDENGMLVSTILRQYFISLKVLSLWRGAGQGVHEHWSQLHQDLHQIHPAKEAKQDDSVKEETGQPNEPSSQEQEYNDGESRNPIVRNAQASAVTQNGGDSDSDNENAHPSGPEGERKLHLMRKVMRKWCRLTGLQGKVDLGAEKDEELSVPWTKGIAPRLEGRIKMIGAQA